MKFIRDPQKKKQSRDFVDLAATLLKMRADAANRHQISLVDSSAFLTLEPNSEWNCEANPARDY